MADLDPAAVALRLAELRRISVLETVDEGRRRPEPASVEASFAAGVSTRLAELGALCELTDPLHRRRAP